MFNGKKQICPHIHLEFPDFQGASQHSLLWGGAALSHCIFGLVQIVQMTLARKWGGRHSAPKGHQILTHTHTLDVYDTIPKAVRFL